MAQLAPYAEENISQVKPIMEGLASLCPTYYTDISALVFPLPLGFKDLSWSSFNPHLTWKILHFNNKTAAIGALDCNLLVVLT